MGRLRAGAVAHEAGWVHLETQVEERRSTDDLQMNTKAVGLRPVVEVEVKPSEVTTQRGKEWVRGEIGILW